MAGEDFKSVGMDKIKKCDFKFCLELPYKKCEQCNKTAYCFHHAKTGCTCLECGLYVCNRCESDQMNLCRQDAGK